ncbi:MAG TPA: EpsI family protein [Armatimonadota bacterium]|jgi:EpsI family protein
MMRYRLLVVNGLLLLGLLGARWATGLQNTALVDRDFLRPLSLPFRDWRTSDLSVPKDQLEVLQPDAVLLRHYESKRGDQVELAVIAGSRKRSVHTPGYCMPGGGWEVIDQRHAPLELPGRSITATRALMANDKGQALLATYFFTDGDYATDNLVRFQAMQLWKRLRREVPLGALVRVLVPLRKDSASAIKLSDEFCRATLPPTLARLHQVRLEGRTAPQEAVAQAR